MQEIRLGKREKLHVFLYWEATEESPQNYGLAVHKTTLVLGGMGVILFLLALVYASLGVAGSPAPFI